MPKPASTYLRYGRISKLNGRAKGDNLSIAEQEREIERIAAAYNLKLAPDLISDEDVSGSTFDRPGWNRAIGLVLAGKAAGIVAFDLKRISRGKTAEVLRMIEDVEAAGGKLYDSTGPVSMEDADAELVTTVKAMIARREWRERKAYLDRSVESAIGRGVHLGAPYGYAKANGKGSRLVPVAAEAEQVRKAFQMRAEGATWGKIAEALNASGPKPRPYKRHGVVKPVLWRPQTVTQLVKNETYLGTAWHGDHRHPGAHEALVTPELFAKANRAKGVKPVGPDERYLLSGLVRCSSCGYVMTSCPAKDRRYYRCRAAQHGDGRCPAPANVPADALEQHLWDTFMAEFVTGGTATPWAADETVEAARAGLDAAKARLKNAMTMKIGLVDAKPMELEVAEETITEARAVLAQAEQAYTKALATARGAELPALAAETAGDAPVSERRHWLSLVYRCVTVRSARAWREPAAERVRVVRVDDAPADSTSLIRWVASQPN
jgi:DNA invertase Pin-like site-specific DNA recombinase